MALEHQDFKIRAGDAREIGITISGSTTLTGATFEWSMGRTGDSTPVITKYSTASEITVSSLVATVILNSTDTEDLTGNYVHQLNMLDASNKPDVVAEGMVRVKPSLFV